MTNKNLPNPNDFSEETLSGLCSALNRIAAAETTLNHLVTEEVDGPMESLRDLRRSATSLYLNLSKLKEFGTPSER